MSDSSCPINIISKIFTRTLRNCWGHLLVNYKIGAVRSQHVSRVYKRMKPAQKCREPEKEKEYPDDIVKSLGFPVTQANKFPLWFRSLFLEAKVV